MNDTKLYQADSNATALVLFDPRTSGLWDEKTSKLIETLEETTEAFVTSVTTGKDGLSPKSAIDAARFMGCDEAIVITPLGCQPQGFEHAGDSAFALTFSQASWVPAAIIDAYRDARHPKRKAA